MEKVEKGTGAKRSFQRMRKIIAKREVLLAVKMRDG
jgi:hypothetical protein